MCVGLALAAGGAMELPARRPYGVGDAILGLRFACGWSAA
jgi:hypothetical protein